VATRKRQFLAPGEYNRRAEQADQSWVIDTLFGPAGQNIQRQKELWANHGLAPLAKGYSQDPEGAIRGYRDTYGPDGMPQDLSEGAQRSWVANQLMAAMPLVDEAPSQPEPSREKLIAILSQGSQAKPAYAPLKRVEEDGPDHGWIADYQSRLGHWLSDGSLAEGDEQKSAAYKQQQQRSAQAALASVAAGDLSAMGAAGEAQSKQRDLENLESSAAGRRNLTQIQKQGEARQEAFNQRSQAQQASDAQEAQAHLEQGRRQQLEMRARHNAETAAILSRFGVGRGR
jgi:hypothetical protein